MHLSEKIKAQLKTVLEDDATIELIDDRGDGYHFSIKIVSKLFEGKNRIQRSQLIYGALDDLMKFGEIHALQLKLTTPDEQR